MEQPPTSKFTCQKCTDIAKGQRDTAAQISPTETNLSGDREQPTEILSETGRDRALIVSPSLIGDSCPEITALLTLGEWHTKDSEEAEEKVVSKCTACNSKSHLERVKKEQGSKNF